METLRFALDNPVYFLRFFKVCIHLYLMPNHSKCLKFYFVNIERFKTTVKSHFSYFVKVQVTNVVLHSSPKRVSFERLAQLMAFQ